MSWLKSVSALALVTTVSVGHAQSAAPAPVAETAPASGMATGDAAAAAVAQNAITFDSARGWNAARYYVIGRWIAADRVEWLGSRGNSRVLFADAACSLSGPDDVKVIRNREVDKSLENAEVVQQGEWIAIEVSPSVQAEDIGIESIANDDCLGSMSLKYSWTKGTGEVQPLTFYSPSASFFGYDITFTEPATEVRTESDIQMDLMMGVWQAKVPNAVETANKTLIMSPTAVARGEWMPTQEHWGLALSFEQGVANFGGVENQSALYSDWAIGGFGEYVLSIADAFQSRVYLRYHQHLGDDASAVPTLAPANKVARYLTMTLSNQLYFSRRWLVGMDIDYGPSLRLAGRGINQGMIGVSVRAGYRITSFLFFIVEGGYRAYTGDNILDESVVIGQAGVRLEL